MLKHHQEYFTRRQSSISLTFFWNFIWCLVSVWPSVQRVMKFSYLYFTVHYCWHLESRLISLCSSVLCSGVHCCCCWVEGSSVFYFVHHSHKAHPAPLLHSSLCSLRLKYSVKQFSLNQLYVLCLDWEIFSSWLPPVLVTRSYGFSLTHFARHWPSRLFLVLFLG